MSKISEFKGELIFFGLYMWIVGGFLTFTLDFSLPWYGQLFAAMISAFYAAMAWRECQDIFELFEEQAGSSSSSSSGREVIPVEVKP